MARGRSLEQIPWTTYFERELHLRSHTNPDLTYHVYLTSPVEKGPLFVMHHGAGSSGLSFAVVGAEVRARLPSAGILSVDCRGHGSTVAPEDSELDLRLETLSSDLFDMIELTKEQMRWQELPPIVLVGHSLGGAVVTDLAKSFKLGTALLGFAVLDVVEGSAMDALQSMQTYLSTRPRGFASLAAGIDWHIRSRTVRNAISARTSVPPLLVFNEGEDSSRPWKWRTNLGSTQPFWEDWFVGLSRKFLESRGGKLLLLAGTDRLDTELTIGQMQGKGPKSHPQGLDLDSLTLTFTSQGNTLFKSSQKLAISSTRIYPKRRLLLSWTFTVGMTGAPSCYHQRSQTC